MTFILRLSVDEAGRVTGIIERVKTREKQRFHGLEAIGPLIEHMRKCPKNIGPSIEYHDFMVVPPSVPPSEETENGNARCSR